MPTPRADPPAPDDDITDDVEVISLLASRTAGRTPEGLRDRILANARAERFAFIRDDAGLWLDHPSGGAVKELFHDSQDRATTRLVKLSAGQQVPSPSIAGSLAVFVVTGTMSAGDVTLGTGDFAMGGVDRQWIATSDTLLLEFASGGGAAELVSAASGARWQALFPGARMRPLAGSPNAAQSVFVLDMSAHSTLGEHDHEGLEELYVLRGSCVIEGQAMASGDYHRAAPGTHHSPTATDEGCLLVVSVRDLPRLAA